MGSGSSTFLRAISVCIVTGRIHSAVFVQSVIRWEELLCHKRLAKWENIGCDQKEIGAITCFVKGAKG